MAQKSIKIITYGHFEEDLLLKIKQDIEISFGSIVEIEENHMQLTDHYNPSRRQYNANTLLQSIQAIHSDKHLRTVGLFRVDLFIPILTFIFGQAEFKGTVGIASLYRLRNEQYGLPGNNDLLFDRFRKVIIHELGHSFGLIHCIIPSCVMRSSTYVEDIDQKKHIFCNKCQNELNNFLKSINSF